MLRAAGIVAAVVGLAGGGGGGGERLPAGALPPGPAALRVSSPAVRDGGALPRRFTCDGAGDEPAVITGRLPAGAREVALVVTDPDAPGGAFVHLTRYGLHPRAGGGPLPRGGRAGRNSTGKDGWTPACPPKGAGAHRYRFTVYALRARTGLAAGAAPADLTAALRRAGVLARGTTTARYGR